MFSKQSFTLIAGACLFGLVLATEQGETGVDILSKKHEVMDQIKRGITGTITHDIEQFILDGSLTLDTFVKNYAASYAKVDCIQGLLAVFVGEFDSLAVCLAAAIVYLISSAVGIALKLIGAKGWHFHLPFGLRDSEPYLEIEHFGNKVRYDTVGVPYEEFTKRDNEPLAIDLPASFDVSDVRIYTNYVGNATFNTVSYNDEFGTHFGIESTGNVASYFTNLEQEQALSKRGSGSSITFSLGQVFDVGLGDVYDALKGTIHDVKEIGKYFEKPQTSYCMELSKANQPLINGELFIGTRGKVSDTCSNTNSYNQN